jgi:hypothetical protein
VSYFRFQVSHDTISGINRTLGNYRSAAAIGAIATASSRLPSALHSVEEERSQAALSRVVGATERCVNALLIQVTEIRLPLTNSVVDRLWSATAVNYVEKWEARKEAWATLHGVKFSSAGDLWQRLDAFVLARNIVAHGLGELTLKQRRSTGARTAAVQKLGRVGIQVTGDYAEIDRQAVESGARVCKDFVEWLDGNAP